MTLQLVQLEKTAEFQNTPPRRKANSEMRPREYLTSDEVKRLRDGARSTGRYRFRDSLLIATMFRHGLRAAELVNLVWDDFMLSDGKVNVRRVKNGTPSVHFLTGPETRELRRLRRESATSRFMFCSERGGPLTQRSVHAIVQRAGKVAGFTFDTHPHMLRHARGFLLANRGEDTRAIQAFMGHADIRSTVVYTTLAPGRFKGFTDDE
jgi:type 1 fimbriae regulatory protein FimB/type 1 fimbriae regulatory protein FimE